MIADESIDENEIAKELYYALVVQKDSDDIVLSADQLGTLTGWGGRFLEMLEEFLQTAKSNLKIDSMFITPADLAYHAENLETVDRIEITRE